MRPNMADSRPLGPAQALTLSGRRALYEDRFKSLEEFMARPGVAASVTAIVAKSRRNVAAAQEAIDGLVKKLDGSGQAVAAAAEWTQLCDAPFNDLQTIGFTALDEAAARAADLRDRAVRMLALCLAVLAATVGGFR